MAMFRYAVLRMNAEWKIVCARRRIGHFTTSESAVDTLRKLAKVADEAGHQVEMLVQGPAGELFPIPLTHLAQDDFDLSELVETVRRPTSSTETRSPPA
jgi:hypothetical protein